MDIREMDAAQALLMGPWNSNTLNDDLDVASNEPEEKALGNRDLSTSVEHGFVIEAETSAGPSCIDEQVVQRRPRSASETLEYLAALAGRERCAVEVSSLTTTTTASNSVSNSSSSSSDDDSEAMPPPPPRGRQVRPRSISNPEGMEKWSLANEVIDPYSAADRRHFVLPASILAEELRVARVAAREFQSGSPPSIPEDAEYHDDSSFSQTPQDDDEDNDVDNFYENLSPDQLLHRARSRLLEDLSESCVTGEKGILTLPHALAKYKEVRGSGG
jgi:hypothetical protein